MEEENKESGDSFVCPSFSAYSSNKLNDIADQVTRDNQNDYRFAPNDNDDTDFEFVAFRKVADGVFFDSSPAFPVFDRDLAGDTEEGSSAVAEDAEAIQITLGKLLMEDSPASSSSSEVEDELEAIPPGTYCVWTPKPVEASPNRCKKSKSTGSSSSSKRWKLLDLLRRSNSEGKESYVFLTPSSSSVGLSSAAKKKVAKEENSKNIPAERKIPAVSAHEALYVRNREMRRVDKRKSYLPYRQDLVGFCVRLNAMGKGFPLHF